MQAIFIVLSFIFLVATFPVSAKEKNKTINYIYVSKGAPANSVIDMPEAYVTFGPQRFLWFQKDFANSEKFSGPLFLKGSAHRSRIMPDGNIVVIGTNYDRPFGFKDTRQNFVSIIKPKTFKEQKTKIFEERGSIDLKLSSNDNIAYLSIGDAYYKLSILTSDLNVVESTKFGNGKGSASLEITPSGNYAVASIEDAIPTYWEFSETLDLVEKKTFDNPSALRGMKTIKLLTRNNELYLAYGWGKGTVKGDPTDGLMVVKIKGENLWKKEIRIPNKTGLEFFISDKGPYALYPYIDYIEKLTFDLKTGDISKTRLNRPLEPVECFPPTKKYDLVDILEDQGKELIVLSNTPLDDHRAGCTTIGILP